MDIENLNLDYYLNVYRFGSRVYGTYNEQSDEDYICILKNNIIKKENNINIQEYYINEFLQLIDNQDIVSLECLCLDKQHILKEEIKFNFQINPIKLRHSISTVTSGSWIKDRKKLIIASDYNKYLGIKSYFHSLRILDYGIQLAKYNKIINYQSMNFVWEDILIKSKNYDRQDLSNLIEIKYKQLYNKMKSEFKRLCPKRYNKNDIKYQKLIETLKNYKINNPNLIEDILNIFLK